MKKKIIAILLVISLIGTMLVACSAPTEENGGATDTTSDDVDVVDDTEVSDLPKDVEEEFRLFDDQGNPLNPSRDAVGENGIVSSQKYEASKIGADIIAKGGNAIDAAVATSFALGVVEPNASGLGGGGFMTFRDAETGETKFIDFREIAPINSTPDMYPLDDEGNVVDNLKARGGLAVGVPGEVAGLLYILEEYGTMSREEVIRPAIDLAINGFVVTPKHEGIYNDAFELMQEYPESGKGNI